jgi:hypothetical protein
VFTGSYGDFFSTTFSDVGLILLGYAVARLTKKETIADAIKELVTDPLNMEACFLPLSKGNIIIVHIFVLIEMKNTFIQE